MSIYYEPEYNKHTLIMGEKMQDTRTETIQQIRELIASMSAREKRGLKPATIEKLLKQIEEQINER
jgi:hypothetical protein